MPVTYTYSWHCYVCDEHDINPQLQNLPASLHINLFSVRISISLKFISSNAEVPILTPFPPFVCSFVATYEHLLGDCPGFMRENLPPIVSDQCVASLALEVKPLAEQMVVRRIRETSKAPRFLPLTVDLDIDFEYDQERDEDTIVNWIARQSMQDEDGMVPASEEAVSSLLKKVKFQTNVQETEQCNICLEEFEVAEDISEMPCHHIYHHECIIQWLKISHVCPLCRRELPTESDV